ncbi:MAG: DMP19 family protein, partial [Pirellulales bacterium]|nr:DMP19 family protein [Pirellulales bacterium]
GIELESIPTGFKILYLVTSLDWEVQNGGFVQYFDNCGTDHSTETIRALWQIDADRFADILKDAVSRFREIQDVERARGEEIPADDYIAQFSEFDDKYFESLAHLTIWELLERYILAHPEEFALHSSGSS